MQTKPKFRDKLVRWRIGWDGTSRIVGLNEYLNHPDILAENEAIANNLVGKTLVNGKLVSTRKLEIERRRRKG